ncbi:hypothetical protein PPL_11129 [Heterostelium album PN500]|uniref:EF-hand domain-containing protein n=1 Tax=Heterostelium pallidum (strain ATCC 26659 / Pp 5 / PN500) TaxID=670386 RepID=D3BT08_HETP5|nr:hypothetical protein PPL_11129 [Heterostelium album PN500]EFA75623.1 hypothetical protein PPL_11129 [Heterostelium album PN500]|eukprot:XP_020427757.1 hypothetical protein PPL_11129 [Heterostelium album PN500]
MGSSLSTLNNEQLKSISLTTENTPKIIQEFRNADTNKTGLTLDQFKTFFRASIQECDDATLQSIFDSFDSDKNNLFSFKEFSSCIFLLTKTDTNRKLEFLFETFDDDNSGYLSTEELKNVIEVMNTTIRIIGGQDINDRIDSLIASMERSGPENGISKTEWVSKASADQALLSAFN